MKSLEELLAIKEKAQAQMSARDADGNDGIRVVVEPGKEKVTYVQKKKKKAVKVITEHVVNGKPVAEYTVGAVTE